MLTTIKRKRKYRELKGKLETINKEEEFNHMKGLRLIAILLALSAKQP